MEFPICRRMHTDQDICNQIQKTFETPDLLCHIKGGRSMRNRPRGFLGQDCMNCWMQSRGIRQSSQNGKQNVTEKETAVKCSYSEQLSIKAFHKFRGETDPGIFGSGLPELLETVTVYQTVRSKWQTENLKPLML